MKWRKSSYSGQSGGNCVEVTDNDSRVLVRDTNDRTGPVLKLSPEAWRKFTKNLKNLRQFGDDEAPADHTGSCRGFRLPLRVAGPRQRSGRLRRNRPQKRRRRIEAAHPSPMKVCALPSFGVALRGRTTRQGRQLRVWRSSVRSFVRTPRAYARWGPEARTDGRGREPWPREARRCTDVASLLHCRCIAAALAHVLS